ncbi:hypothetical protein N0V90_011914 [Kalmusia sp. IMI 367209]|nr:hypothetical protein N0V90_011914 [Kalmusia sp. IMI 367209]
MLAGYKSTIVIALTDASLYNSRKSLTTAESVDNYRDMIKTATFDLEARLEFIDGKLESIFEQNPTETDSNGTEILQLKEDRLST